MEKKTRTALVLVLLIVAGAGVGYAVLNEPYTAETGIEYTAGPDGPTVTLGEQTQLQAEQPFPDSQTIDLHPHGVITSTGETSLKASSLDSEFASFEQINTNQNTIEADMEDQTSLDISGEVDSISFGTVDPTSTDTEISHTGDVTLTVHMEADADTYLARDSDGTTLDSDTGPNPTFELTGSNDVTIVEADSAPVIDRDSIEPGSDAVSNIPFTMGADVSDPDGGQVTVEFIVEGETVGNDTVDGEGRAEIQHDEDIAGEYDWRIEATDEFDQTTVEDGLTFYIADELQIRDELEPENLIDDETEVEVRFFDGDTIITRSTTDGSIDLEGLPAGEPFVVEAEADDYITRQTIVPSITEQQNVYLLPNNADSVSVRFDLDDSTGSFPAADTRILVEKPITKDGETSYEVIAGDDYGSQGFSTVLASDQRYRTIVENTETGARQSLGPYVASQSETVRLNVDSIDFDTEVEDIGYRWSANYQNETEPRVSFNFEADNSIRDLSVTIRERGGDESVLLTETYTDVQQVSEIADLGDVENPDETTYVVEWEAVVVDENGETFEVSGTEVVGASQMPIDIPGVGDSVLHVVSVLLLFLVGGLFSAANVEIGGIVVSLTAAAFWFIGMLPGAVSGLFIAAALLLSIMWMVRSQRGEQ